MTAEADDPLSSRTAIMRYPGSGEKPLEIAEGMLMRRVVRHVHLSYLRGVVASLKTRQEKRRLMQAQRELDKTYHSQTPEGKAAFIATKQARRVLTIRQEAEHKLCPPAQAKCTSKIRWKRA